jgi:hypothetical protein
MVALLTPKSRSPHRCIVETKTTDGSTGAKVSDPRTNPNTKEAATTPKPHTHPPHERDGQARNPGAMIDPLTPKPTRKVEVLTRAPSTIVLRHEEDTALKEVAMLPRYCGARCILETKTTDGSTTAKAPTPRTNPNTKEAPTAPKPHTHPPQRS